MDASVLARPSAAVEAAPRLYEIVGGSVHGYAINTLPPEMILFRSPTDAACGINDNLQPREVVWPIEFIGGFAQAGFDGDGELTLFDFVAFQHAFQDGCAEHDPGTLGVTGARLLRGGVATGPTMPRRFLSTLRSGHARSLGTRGALDWPFQS